MEIEEELQTGERYWEPENQRVSQVFSPQNSGPFLESTESAELRRKSNENSRTSSGNFSSNQANAIIKAESCGDAMIEENYQFGVDLTKGKPKPEVEGTPMSRGNLSGCLAKIPCSLEISESPNEETKAQKNKFQSFIMKMTQEGKKRWLKVDEILKLLALAELPECVGLKVSSLPQRPAPGFFCVVQISSAESRRWKKDGYHYEKRKNGSGFKESSEILRHCGKKVLSFFLIVMAKEP
jgi:CG-1 domain